MFRILRRASPGSAPPDSSELIRAVLLGIFLLGIGGLTLELVLLEHYEDAWQWTPFVLFAAALGALGWYAVTRGRRAILAFRAVMVLFLIGGVLGVYLHYSGNVEFELEMSPDVLGWALFREAIFGATPTLAPGALLQLGLLGLALTIRHPALASSGREPVAEQPE